MVCANLFLGSFPILLFFVASFYYWKRNYTPCNNPNGKANIKKYIFIFILLFVCIIIMSRTLAYATVFCINSTLGEISFFKSGFVSGMVLLAGTIIFKKLTYTFYDKLIDKNSTSDNIANVSKWLLNATYLMIMYMGFTSGSDDLEVMACIASFAVVESCFRTHEIFKDVKRFIKELFDLDITFFVFMTVASSIMALIIVDIINEEYVIISSLMIAIGIFMYYFLKLEGSFKERFKKIDAFILNLFSSK